MALKKVSTDIQYDMRGLFTIVKGQYCKKAPAVVFEDKETRYLGGYDPNSEETEEWYQLMDTENFNTVICGGDLNKVLKGVYNLIIEFNNDRQAYLSKHNIYTTFEDESGKKNKRCSTSPIMVELDKHIYETYGDYFSDMIEDMEDKAIEELKSRNGATKKTIKKSTKKPLKKTVEEVPNSPKKTLKKSVPNKSIACTKEVLEMDEEELVFSEAVVEEPPKKKVVKKTTKAPQKDSGKKQSKGLSLFKSI